MCLAGLVIVTHVCFLSTSSDADVAPGLIWQMGGSMMFPLFTGWLTWCGELRSQLAVALLLVPSIHGPSPRQQVGDQSFSRWLLIHRCPQHRNSDLKLQNEKNTTTCEFNSRTVKSAQTLLTSVDDRFDASVHQPRETQDWSPSHQQL